MRTLIAMLQWILAAPWQAVRRAVAQAAIEQRILSPQQRKFSEIESAAIAIRAVSGHQRHLGVLHRDADLQDVFLLHLAWHCRLQNDQPDDDYLWIDPAIPSRRLRQVAAMCRRVWRSNQGTLPYAFSSPNDCIDVETGEYLLGPTRHGLTCATFVLAVFQSAGIKLLNYDEWPKGRPGDNEWQQEIIDLLRGRASAEHIRAIESEVGAVRIRPEEVAGAAASNPLPASFAKAIRAGQLVLRRLAARN